MKTSQEFIDEVKTKSGDQVTRDGRLIRDLDDKELMKKMLERYPGERENIADIDEYLGEEAQNLPDTPAKSDVQEQLDKVTKSPGFLERVKNRAVNTYENVKSEIQRTGENEGQSALRSGFDAVAGVATSIPGFAKEALPEFARDAVDYVGEKGGELYNKAVVEPLANTELIKGAAEGYNAAERGEVELSPLASALPDALGIAGSAGEIAGSILGAKGVFDAGKGTFNTAKNAPAKIDAALEPRRQAKIESRKAEVDDAVKRIIQGAPEDVDAAKRALTSIETTGVKTYKELKDVMKDEVETLSEKLDTLLDTEAPTPLKADQLSQYIKVGDKTVAQSPVQTALKELGDYYNKINDAASAEKIRQITEKLDTDGLTLKEVNNIAKLHGRDLNAFNANGELASGLSKQAAENTRKGLKTVVRDRTTGDAAKAIDSQISDLLQTSKLVDDMEVKVQKLYQKIKKRTLAAKVGGAAADVLDLATMGTLRGFVAKLFPSNVGLKTANSLDLEKELSKNLKKIDELTAIEDPKKFSDAMSTYMEEMQPGLSTRLVSGLTAPEKDVLLKKLMSTDSKSVMKKDQADLELFDRLETMKETADKRPLTEREFVELRTLMDEVPESFNQGATPATTDLVQEAKKYKSAEDLSPGTKLFQNNGSEMEMVGKMNTPKGEMYAFRTKGQPEGSFELFTKDDISDLLGKQDNIIASNSEQTNKTESLRVNEDISNAAQKQRDEIAKQKEVSLVEFLDTLETGDRLNATKSLRRLVSKDGKMIKEFEAIEEFIRDGYTDIKELRQTRGAKKGQLVKSLVSQNGRVYPLDSKAASAYAEYIFWKQANQQ